MIPLTVCIVWLVSFKMAEKTSVDSSAGKVTQLPIARVKTIMKSSPEQPHFSQDSVFLITKATVGLSFMFQFVSVSLFLSGYPVDLINNR